MKLLCALCVVCGLVSSALAIDREAFTFTKYDLEIRLEPDQQRLGARGKITLRNESLLPQKIAVLQISSSLDWRSIKVDGKAVQFVSQSYASDIDHTGALSEGIVTLPAEIKSKNSVEIEIGYEGTIVQDGTRLTQIGIPEDIAKHSSWDQISATFTAVRGAGYVAWYPIATESADFSEGNSMFQVADRWRAREAESEFSAKISMSRDSGEQPPALVCAHGDTGAIEQLGRAQKVSAECSWKPLSTVTPTFVMAQYELDVEAKYPLVRVFRLPDHQAGAGLYSDALEPAFKFVSNWFGVPNSAIAIADLADAKAAPFESGTLLLTSMAGEDPKLVEINLVHELVHSAFTSARPWINEGLAHFAEIGRAHV